MAKASDTKEILSQNLLGAACGEALMEQLMDLASDGRIAEDFARLPGHRWFMSDSRHTEQQKPDRLDSLICRL